MDITYLVEYQGEIHMEYTGQFDFVPRKGDEINLLDFPDNSWVKDIDCQYGEVEKVYHDPFVGNFVISVTPR